MKDLISRADAIEAVHKYFVRALNNEPHEIDEDGDDVFTDMKSVNALLHHNKYVSKALKELPSAEAEPIVIRSRTLMPTKDFKEWAKRVRDENPNVIVIPCDAEVVSAEAVQGEWEHWGSPFSDESEVIDTIVCSVCGARFIEPKDEPKGEYNYCPNCGALMLKGGDTK